MFFVMFLMFLMFLITSPSNSTASESAFDSSRPPVTGSPLKRARTLQSASEERYKPLCADGYHEACAAAGSPRVRVGYHVGSPKTDDPTLQHFLRATDDKLSELEKISFSEQDVSRTVNFAFVRFLLQKPDGEHIICALDFSTDGIVSIVPLDDARKLIKSNEFFESGQTRTPLDTTLHLAELLSSLQKNKDPASFYNTYIAGKFYNKKTDMVRKIIDLYTEYMKLKKPNILYNINSAFGEAKDANGKRLETLLHSINGSGCAEQYWAREVLNRKIQIPTDFKAFTPGVTKITSYTGSLWTPCIACASLLENGGLIYDANDKILSALNFPAEREYVFTALYPYEIESRTTRGKVQTPAYPNHTQDMSGMWELRIIRDKWDGEQNKESSTHKTKLRHANTIYGLLKNVTNHPEHRTKVYPSPGGDATKDAAKQAQLEAKADAANSDTTATEGAAGMGAARQLF